MKKILSIAFLVLFTSCASQPAQKELVLTGNGKVLDWPKKSWTQASEHTTSHYEIKTNTHPNIGLYIGKLMENAREAYCELISCGSSLNSPYSINVYATRKEYDKVAVNHGFFRYNTAGFYSDIYPQMIHLPYIFFGKKHPTTTLIHEGFHQVADREGYHFPVWLNEGLATYFESSLIPENEIVIGKMNFDRLDHLKRILKRIKKPKLDKLFMMKYKDGITAEDYALSWGIIYALRHGPENLRNIEELDSYISIFKGESEEISKKSLFYFEQFFIGKNSSLKEWRDKWIEYIQSL